MDKTTIRVIAVVSGKCQSCGKSSPLIDFDFEVHFDMSANLHTGERLMCETCITDFYSKAMFLLHPRSSDPSHDEQPKEFQPEDWSKVDWAKRPRPSAIDRE